MGLALFEIEKGILNKGDLVYSKVEMTSRFVINSSYAVSPGFLSCDKGFKRSVAKQILFSYYRKYLPEVILYDLLDIAIPDVKYFNRSLFSVCDPILPVLDIDHIQEFVSSIVENDYCIGIKNRSNYKGSQWNVYKLKSESSLCYHKDVFLILKIIKEFSNIDYPD
jgi:hypothetical protein